jgi:hypothetical protein
MKNAHDWLSRPLEMTPVKGTLDYRRFLGAPWRTLLTGARRRGGDRRLRGRSRLRQPAWAMR